MLDIKIKKLSKNVELPKQSTQGAAGMDFYLPQPVRFEPNRSKKVPLGVAVEIPEGYVMLLIPRSSMWTTPLRMPNSVGVIDSDYRGEVCALLQNTHHLAWTAEAGERLVQGVIVPVPEVQIQEVEELSETSRGVGGFGSTGK
nr:MAG TPA: dUTPase [Caudoviricetes sp.]